MNRLRESSRWRRLSAASIRAERRHIARSRDAIERLEDRTVLSFSPATNFAVGTNPFSVTVGDFNGDGQPDLAAANYNSGNVSVLLGGAPATAAVNLSVSAATGTEAGTTVITVTATAASAVTGDQTVSLAVTGTGITAGDYALSNSTITILNGATTGTVTFTIVDDLQVESTEMATLTISSPSAGITLGTTLSQNIAITDNDTATAAVYSTPVNNGADSVRVVLNGLNLEIRSVPGDVLLESRAVAGLTGGITIQGAAGEDDTLTVDFGGTGNPIPSGGLTFHGGTGGNDKLIITGGTFATVVYDATAATNGTLNLAGSMAIFTGLEPVDLTGSTITDLTINVDPSSAVVGTVTTTIAQDVVTTDTLISFSGGLESTLIRGITGTLTINGDNVDADLINVSGVGSSFAAALTIDGQGGSDTVNLNGDITFASGKSLLVTAETLTTAASADLTTSGAGVITLTTNDVALDATSTLVSAGTVTLKPQTVSRAINLGTATGGLDLTDSELDRITAGTVQIGDSNSGTITISASLTQPAKNLSLTTGAGVTGSGDVINGSATATTLTVNQAGNSSYSGLLGGPSGGTANDKNLALVKQGAGTLILSGANNYTGATSVSQGVLKIQNGSALGATGAGSATTVTAGAALEVEGGISVNESLTLNGSGVGGTGALRNIASNNFWTGPITLASNVTIGGTSGGPGNEMVYSGGIGETGGARNLSTVGNGISIVMQSANTYTGTTTVIGAGSAFRLRGPSTNLVINGPLVIGDGATGANVILDNSDQIADTVDVTINSDGNFLLGGFPSGTSRTETIDELSGAGTLGAGTTGTESIIVGANNGSSTFSGTISNIAAGRVVNLTKIGSGTLILSGSNTYSGTTSVSQGTLALSNASNNNLANSATIDMQSGAILDVTALDGGVGTADDDTLTLASGQTLKGNGTVTGKTVAASGSAVSPGASPGVLHTGDITFASGSDFNVEIDGTSGAGAVGGHDQIDVTGSVTLNDGNLVVLLGYTPANGDSFVIINNDSTEAVMGLATFKVAGNTIADGGAFVAGGNRFVIDYTSGTDSNDVTLIADNGNIDYTIGTSAMTVTETAQTLTFTVTRSGSTTYSASSVNFAITGTAANPADFNNIGGTSGATGLTGTISFAVGQISKTITLNILSDTLAEGDETIVTTLSNATAPGTATISTPVATTTINDDDIAYSINTNFASVSESVAPQTVTFTVTRAGSTNDAASSVNFAISGTAASGLDYNSIGGTAGATTTSGTINFAIGQTSKTITLVVQDDVIVEVTESIVVTLSSATAPGTATISPSSATTNITDNEPPTIVLNGGGGLTIQDSSGNRTDRLTVTYDVGTNSLIFNDPNNPLPTGVGIQVNANTVRVPLSALTTQSLTFNLNNLDDKLDIRTVPSTFAILINGGDGNDTIYGNNSNDTINSGNGNDSINAGSGNDSIDAGTGNDTVFGGDGTDSIIGGIGADSLSGDGGNDTLVGGADNDTLLGGDGNDSVTGDAGADSINGGNGNDSIMGGAGNDVLAGQAGVDTVMGESGNDTIAGGSGSDKDVGDVVTDLAIDIRESLILVFNNTTKLFEYMY